MKVQTVATIYIERDADGVMAARHRRGEVFELESSSEAKAGIDAGLLRPADETGDLPEPNWAAVDRRPTQPDGTPIDADADGNKLTVGPAAVGAEDAEWKPPRTHKEADAMLSEYSISMPAKATVAQKVAAVEQYRAASLAGDTTQAPSELDLSTMDDSELIQIGVDSGLTEDEMVELGHDELVLRVAEVMNLRTHGSTAAEAELTEG